MTASENKFQRAEVITGGAKRRHWRAEVLYSYKAQMSYFYIMTGERDPSIDPDRHVSYYNSAILFVGLSLLSFIGGALLCASALFFHEGGAVALAN